MGMVGAGNGCTKKEEGEVVSWRFSACLGWCWRSLVGWDRDDLVGDGVIRRECEADDDHGNKGDERYLVILESNLQSILIPPQHNEQFRNAESVTMNVTEVHRSTLVDACLLQVVYRNKTIIPLSLCGLHRTIHLLCPILIAREGLWTWLCTAGVGVNEKHYGLYDLVRQTA
jgi:hypothetical protein